MICTWVSDDRSTTPGEGHSEDRANKRSDETSERDAFARGQLRVLNVKRPVEVTKHGHSALEIADPPEIELAQPIEHVRRTRSVTF